MLSLVLIFRGDNDRDKAFKYVNSGKAWSDMGEYDRAIEDYTEAVRIWPPYADAYKNRAIAWSNKGENDRARKDRKKARELGLKIDPTE